MHLVLGEQDAAAARARSIDLVLPARGEPSPHLAPIARVRGNARKIMSMDEQAVLTLWPPTVKEREPYAPTRTMHMEFDKDFKEEGERDTGTITWATDFCMLPDMGKMVISSGERKMYFYDSYGDFALQFVVTHFDAVPTRLCSHFSQDLNATVLFWGDSNGALGALVFPKYFAQSQHFRMHILKGQQPVRIKLDDLWPEPRKLLEYGGVHMRQWHGHSEWVNEIKWIESIGSFVSVSGDCQSSMIVGEVIDLVTQPPDSLKGQSLLNRGDQSIKGRRVNARQLAFSVTKGGIRSVDFSSSLGLLATGGTDRQIRCWSPHMTKHPESVLRGHDASVTALQFKNNKDGHGHHKELMSLDSSQTIKVWDVKAQICILTVSPQMHGITEETTDIYFGERTKALLLFPKSKAGILKIKEGRAGGQGLSHLKPVRCGLFNARFNQMVTACDKGIIKSWCIRTGAPVFEFRGDEGTGAGINSMTLDHTSTKLITAFDSGATTRWQFSTGQKLNAFQESAKSASPEVTRVLFQIAGQMRSVITVGWSRKVTIYRDQPASEHTLDIFPENDHWNSAGRHTDDITAACLFGANTLATGAYNGDVILWNLSTGRPRTLPTRAAMETGLSNPVALQEYIVLALASIPSRVDQRDAAQLIVSTTTGIQFWNTKLGLHGALMGQFKAGPEPGVEAKAITLTDDCRHLIVGDSLGRIAVYDISTYCHKKIAAGAPPLLKQWRAHLNHPVMSLTTVQKDVEEEDSESESGSDDDDDQIAVPVASIPRPGAELTVESPEPAEEVDEADAKAAAKRAAEAAKAKVARAKARAAHRASKAAEPQKFQNFVVSTSSDCRARMWAISGRFLGTFNGEDSWKWEDKSTWQEHDTPVEIRQADEAKKLEDEQDSRLDHMEATGATHSRPKPALAWGLEAAGIPFADPAEAALEDASKIKSPTWDISNPPGDLIEALTGKSNVAMMKYIGAGGGSSGQGFYARRTLQRPKLTGRSQSAPAGLRSRAVVDKPPARRSCRVPVNRGAVIAPGLPRKLGNYERSIRATAKRENEQRVAPAKTRVTKVEAERPEKALYNDAKDRMAATSPELQALAHLEVHEKPLLGHDESYLQEEAPARKLAKYAERTESLAHVRSGAPPGLFTIPLRSHGCQTDEACQLYPLTARKGFPLRSSLCCRGCSS